MQIQQSGNRAALGLPATSAKSANTSSVSVRGDAGENLVGGVEIVGGRADHIASLAAHLTEIPDTRADVVQQARERVEQGHYLTRDAAERTAAQLLGT